MSEQPCLTTVLSSSGEGWAHFPSHCLPSSQAWCLEADPFPDCIASGVACVTSPGRLGLGGGVCRVD